MKYDQITINAVLFYLKDKNTHKYYTVVIIFYLMFTDKI